MAMKDPIDQPPPSTDWFAANAPAPGPTAQQQGLQPVPGQPGLYYNTAGVVFNEAGTRVDGYFNAATGAFQSGTPTTDPTTGIVGPPAVATPSPTTGGGPSTGGGGPNVPAMPTTGFGTVPDPYHSTPWTGGPFVDPTMDQVKAMPGYQTRLDAGLLGRQRSAAAQGTILNGGTQKALERYGQDYAANEFQTARSNAYDNYMTRYKQFTDENLRTLGDYTVNTTNKRNAESDYWSRLQALYGTGATLAGGSYKF
jgi:hypothetical protein